VAAISRTLLLALVALLALPGAAAAQVLDAADALRSDSVYVDPEAERAGDVDAAALRREIGAKPVFIAVLPASAVEGSPGRTLVTLRQEVGEPGTYALVVGDELRTLPAGAASSAQPGDLQAELTRIASDAGSGESGSMVGSILALLVLIAVAAGGVLLLVNRRRKREKPVQSEARIPDVNDDFVRLGDGIRAAEIDVSLTEDPAAKTDYDRAVAAYDRANALHRKGDERAADQALDEGLAAIASAQERLAGRKS
jgi:hypothetical protein